MSELVIWGVLDLIENRCIAAPCAKMRVDLSFKASTGWSGTPSGELYKDVNAHEVGENE